MSPPSPDFWTPPQPLGRFGYRNVQVFVPPTCGGDSLRRLLRKTAVPPYTLFDLESQSWLHGQPLAEWGSRTHLPARGALCIWWYDTDGIAATWAANQIEPAQCKVLVVLRDPRDSLCSSLHLAQDPAHIGSPEYPIAYQRGLELFERAKHWRSDDYARELGPSWLRAISLIPPFVAKLEAAGAEVEFLSYALLCEDFPLFFQRLRRFLNLDLPAVRIAEILDTEDVRRRDTLDPSAMAHYRRASPRPGRHRRELSPPTIAWLNEESRAFREWLAAHEEPFLRACYDD